MLSMEDRIVIGEAVTSDSVTYTPRVIPSDHCLVSSASSVWVRITTAPLPLDPVPTIVFYAVCKL